MWVLIFSSWWKPEKMYQEILASDVSGKESAIKCIELKDSSSLKHYYCVAVLKF